LSYSGGVFSINTTGQPVVAGTTISASVFNALTADLATGLSTCILKDGTQTTTAAIPFAFGISGVTTNSNAAAGVVGEYIESIVAPSTTGLTTGTAANVTSISLTAGDWDVTGNVVLDYGAGTPVLKFLRGSISTTSATHGAVSNSVLSIWDTTSGISPATTPVAVLPVVRLSLSGTTTVYLVCSASFSGVTFGAGGIIRARRVR